MDVMLNLVPKDRFFVPSSERSALARRILANAIPEAAGTSEIEEFFCEEVQYFATGTELEDTDCPLCGESLCEEIDWWARAMSRASHEGFRDLRVITPCCKHVVRLDQLPDTGAFGKYCLTIVNPPRSFISQDLRHALESAVGTELQVVLAKDLEA